MTAHMDSVPMIAITGQVPVNMLGKDSFQESDLFGITMPITKYNYLVKEITDIPRVIKEAVHIAQTGRPGPVLIDLPKNIQLEEISYAEFERLLKADIELECYSPNVYGHSNQINKAAQALNSAKKPIILAGAGITKARATEEFRELVEKRNIPVVKTLLGLDTLPTDHELCLDMVGMHGTVYANLALDEADVVFAVGMRFDDRITGKIERFVKNAKIIHIDIDPAEISKNKKAHIPIVGDIRNVLKKLTPKLEAKENEDWIKRIKHLKKSHPITITPKKDEILPQQVIDAASKYSEDDSIICTDVGQHQMWAALYYRFHKANTFCSSGGAGTMGYGIPAVIGANVAKPDTKVIGLIGDGGFQMTMQDLITIKQYNLKSKLIIVNNSFLGMVRQWQEIFHQKRYSHVDMSINPDFEKIAEANFLDYVKIEKPEELDTKFKEAIENDKACIIEVMVKKEENVMPMIPAGGSVENMMTEF
jgi:acetolactate synthase-1/2/3 large subunit